MQLFAPQYTAIKNSRAMRNVTETTLQIVSQNRQYPFRRHHLRLLATSHVNIALSVFSRRPEHQDQRRQEGQGSAPALRLS